MLQKLDLAAIAESIAAPYRPVPLVSLGAVEAALVVCGGPKKWQRSAQRDELLIVLEGHVTIQGNARRVVANEGDVALIPSSMTLAWWSGMRSIAILCQERDRPFNANGYHGAPTGDRELASRTDFAVRARANPAYEWLRLGRVGGYVAQAARLTGPSQPYLSPPGSLIVIVFRGILDVTVHGVGGDAPDRGAADTGVPDAGASGVETVVGSQLLVIPSAERVTFASERGATVLVLARQGAPLPRAAVRTDAPGADAPRSDTPRPDVSRPDAPGTDAPGTDGPGADAPDDRPAPA